MGRGGGSALGKGWGSQKHAERRRKPARASLAETTLRRIELQPESAVRRLRKELGR